MATNTNVNVRKIDGPGSSKYNYKIGYIDSGAKAAQNDTWTIKNIKKLIDIFPKDDTTGAFETHTISSNVVTLTSATTGAKSALVIYI